MMLTAIAFYLFSAIMIAAAFMVVAVAQSRALRAVPDPRLLQRRRACSCFWAPSSSRWCCVFVYVGAVVVLFLFVVMMLDIDFAELRRGVQEYLPLGAGVGVRSRRS